MQPEVEEGIIATNFEDSSKKYYMGEQEHLHVCNVCNTYWTGFFKEAYLCFLIVGHIDQKFSVISNVLKRKDIDMLEEMLQLVEKETSYI